MDSDKKQSFILKIGELGTLFGFSHILGQIYGILFITAKELSLDDIKDTLFVSKATVSLNIRELLKWGAVKRVWKPGTRKDYYEAETDFMKLFNTRLVDALLRRIRLFEEALLVNGKENKGARSGDDKHIDKRLEEAKKISQKVIKLLQMVKNAEKSSILKMFLKNL